MHTELTYPTTPPPPPEIDVVIPYCDADADVVQRAVNSILNQTYCLPTIHLVYDSPTPASPPIKLQPQSQSSSIIKYSTPYNYGPYNIVNAVVHNCKSSFIAIQDADDESLSSRLWKQCAILNLGYVMTSCAMVQHAEADYLGSRHLIEPVIYPGTTFPTAPMGRCINSTRTMNKEWFIKMNGFASMPCCGDFQFDNRAILSNQPLHYSPEILALRYLRPNSLSNGSIGAGTTIRQAAAQSVIDCIITMRRSPTLSQAQSLGSLTSIG